MGRNPLAAEVTDRVLHPRQLPRRQVKTILEAGQGGEDHRVVQKDHEVAQEDADQDRLWCVKTPRVA